MFGLVDTPRPERPVRGSPRMFKADWVERYFSRVRPWHVLAIWVPISLVLLYLAHAAGAAPAAIAGLVLLGLVLWTLLEYVLHRFVFHFEPRGKTQEELAFVIHGIHHDYPWDADRLVMPPAVSLLIGAALWFPVKWTFGEPWFYAVYAGIVIGYLWYDLSHYASPPLEAAHRLGPLHAELPPGAPLQDARPPLRRFDADLGLRLRHRAAGRRHPPRRRQRRGRRRGTSRPPLGHSEIRSAWTRNGLYWRRHSAEVAMVDVTLDLLGKLLEDLQREAAHHRHMYDFVLKRTDEMISRMDALASRVDLVDSRVGLSESRLSSRIGALDDRVGALDDRIGALDDRIGALEDRVGALDGRVGALEDRERALSTARRSCCGSARSVRRLETARLPDADPPASDARPDATGRAEPGGRPQRQPPAAAASARTGNRPATSSRSSPAGSNRPLPAL